MVPDHTAPATPRARRRGGPARVLAAGARPLRLAARERARRRLHEDLLQLHQPAHLRHDGRRRHARIHPAAAGRRAGIAGQAPLSVLARGGDRLPAGAEGLQVPRAVPGRRPRRALHGHGGPRPRRPARDGRERLPAPGIHRLPLLPGRARLPRGAHHPPAPHASGRGGAGEHRGRRPRGRGAARGIPGRQRLQLYPLLLLHRPHLGGGRGAVPALHPAAQADRRAVHRAGPAAPGQDRALPDLLRPPGPQPRPLRAHRRRPRPGDARVHAALLQPGVQGDPGPVRLPEEHHPRAGRLQVPARVPARPRRTPDRHPGVPEPQAPGRPLRAGASRGAAGRGGGDRAPRRRRPDPEPRLHRTPRAPP